MLSVASSVSASPGPGAQQVERVALVLSVASIMLTSPAVERVALVLSVASIVLTSSTAGRVDR